MAFYLSTPEGKRFKVKIINVKTGARLSLQIYHHRYEHLIVVKGTAEIKIENEFKILSENKK